MNVENKKPITTISFKLKIGDIVCVPKKIVDTGAVEVVAVDNSKPHPAGNVESWDYLVAVYDTKEHRRVSSLSFKVTQAEVTTWILNK